MGTDPVKEMAVMRHDDGCVLELIKKILEPHTGFNIEMVRRFVEEQDIRVPEKRLCKKHTHFFACLKLLHRDLMHRVRDPEMTQKFCRLGFGIPAVHIGKFMLQFRGPDAVRIGKIGFRIDRVFLLDDVIKTLIAHDHGREHREFIIGELVLL